MQPAHRTLPRAAAEPEAPRPTSDLVPFVDNRAASAVQRQLARVIAAGPQGLLAQGWPVPERDGAALIQRRFTSPASLTSHFNDHGGEFPYATEALYSAAADAHYAARAGLQSKVSGGKTYVYDAATDTFGSYNNMGHTITFFKPCKNDAAKIGRGYGQDYYDRQ